MLILGKNFCDISPTAYKISVKKEIFKRHIKDLMGNDNFATEKSDDKLPVVAASYDSVIIKTGKGIDPVLQENKAVNIQLASSKINGIIIHPGETFSYWRTTGDATKKRGYKEGRVIRNGVMMPGVGGGLCNLANTINRMVLHTPLEVTEFHKHSDALALEHSERVPLSAGTSVSYNYIDYRFRNNTDQDIQLLVWCEDGRLFGEVRCEREFEHSYRITEDDHHFEKQGDEYFRVSKMYKETLDKESGEVLERELFWDNHSLVMFDPELIPAKLLR